MKTQLIVIFLATISIATGCSGDPAKKAINDYCECTESVRADADELRTAMQSGDMSKMQSMGKAMQKKAEALRTCMKSLEDKYSKYIEDEKFKKAVQAGVEEKCPMKMM